MFWEATIKYKENIMGKQHRKVVKRKRAARRIKRQKEALNGKTK